MFISVALSCPIAWPLLGTPAVPPPTVRLLACAVGAVMLSGGEVLRITAAFCSGLLHAPLLYQVPRSKEWQNGGKLHSDAFEPTAAVSNEQKAF